MSLLQDPSSGTAANIKSGNTAPVAADAAVVVTISPNSPAQVVSGTVITNIGTTNGLALDSTLQTLDAILDNLTIAQGAALDSNTQTMVGGSVTTAAPTYVTGQISPLSLTISGGLRVDGSGVTQPISGTVTANDVPPTITKGTQGTTGFTTQDLKDAGRVIKIYSATYTGATTEALVTLTPISDGVSGTAGTSFTVTAGKRFRIQALLVTTRNASTAGQGTIINLRMSASGAVTAASPLIATAGAGTSLAVANIVGSGGSGAIPDGLELSGTMQFGISQVGTATAGNVVTLIGYEY